MATFDSQGITLVRLDQDVVNASAVPLNLRTCSVIVVASTDDLSTSQTLLQSVATSGDNGFSIDVRANGGLSFRTILDGAQYISSYPASTITADQFFMAVFTFDRGRMLGQCNQLDPVETQIDPYPSAPTTTSVGWFFGRPSATYLSTTFMHLFGSSGFHSPLMATPDVMTYFSGTLAYSMFYDRPLYSFEISSIYKRLKTKLNAERSIALP